MYVVYEILNGVKRQVGMTETEAGAKRSVTCALKRVSKYKRPIAIRYAYMSAEDWKNRPVKMKKVRSLMSGAEVEIPEDTPRCCDPSSELYWSM